MNEQALDNQTKYESMGSVKNALLNYTKLERLAHMGNQTGMAIIIDLDIALAQLEEGEKNAIREVVIKGYTLEEYAEIAQMSHFWVRCQIKEGLLRMSSFLVTGEIIPKKEARKNRRDMEAVQKVKEQSSKGWKDMVKDIMREGILGVEK